ncbi:MAG: hypothetical protein JWO80_4125, partial [Bryobacterales bacterium]|nr:hypothetical protein [Bryobacterales bacterium]
INLYGPLPRPTPVQGWTLLFGFALALMSTVGAGLLPALLSADLPIELASKGGAMRTVTRTGGWRGGIVAVQIALAFTLIFTAAELSRSFLNMTRVPPGFAPTHLWTGAIDLPARTYAADQSWNTKFFEPLVERLRSLPGVEAASAAGAIPFNPSGIWTEELRLAGRSATDRRAEAQISVALPGYFETMGIPLLRGRTFTDRDRAGAQLVAVIDEELARRYFANEEAIGKTIASGGAAKLALIVGVVGSVHNSNLGGDRQPEVYYPELQERSESMYLVLRMKGDADPTAAVRASVAALDPGVALYDVRLMDERVAASLKLRRFTAFLLNGFAIAGVILAGVGLYGSLAHLVELRRREIGIRMALGARPSQVFGMIVGYAAVVVAAGLGSGIVTATAAGRAVRSQLFGVEATDAGIWVGVLSAMVIAAALAAWLPARRAVAVEPSIALRDE